MDAEQARPWWMEQAARPDHGGGVTGNVVGTAKMDTNRPGRVRTCPPAASWCGVSRVAAGSGAWAATPWPGPGSGATRACSSTRWWRPTTAVGAVRAVRVPGRRHGPGRVRASRPRSRRPARDVPAVLTVPTTLLCPKWRAGTYPSHFGHNAIRGCLAVQLVGLDVHGRLDLVERAGHRRRGIGPLGRHFEQIGRHDPSV